MIFTLGRTEDYERYFRGQETPRKKGRDDTDPMAPYDGGSVWRSRKEAEAHQSDLFSVYGVEADWNDDTTPSRSGGPWNDLLRNANLVRLTDHRTSEEP